MLDYLNDYISKTFSVVNIPNIQASDILEIFIIAILIYQISKRLTDTRLFVVAKGILVLLLFYGLLILTHLDILASIFQWLIILCVICIVLACQPELKKIMESAGSKNYIKEFINWWKRDENKEKQLEFSDETVDAIVEACEQMSKTKTGALIVFELDTPLEDIVATGIKLDALITKQLLIQIFEKNTPLHDGALVIKHNRIESATCYLPLSNNLNINKDLGTRHRAGIGVTEQVECFVVIVSEETGAISYVQNGNIRHKVSLKELKLMLNRIQHRKDPIKKKHFDPVKNIRLKNTKHKLIAFVGAIAIWFTILNIIDPVSTRRLSNINIDVINGDIITSAEQTYEVLENNAVSVIIKGRRSVIDNITLEDIEAVADIENMSKVYNVPINIKLLNGFSDHAEITYQSQDNVKILMDTISEKVVKVEYEQVGKLAEDTYINNISTHNEVITIKGANSVVSTIDKVVLPVDVTGATKSFSNTVSPKVYDRNGDEIDLNKLKLSDNKFTVTVEMLNTKTVNLNINILDSVDSAYKIKTFDVEKDSITIGAEDEILELLENIVIDLDITEDIQNITSNKLVKTIDINDYLSDNMVVASSNSKININIEIETPIEKEITVDIDNIEIKGLSSKFDCNIIDNKYTFKLKGYKEDLDKINKENLLLSIDIHYDNSIENEADLLVETEDTEDLNGITFEIIDLPVIEYELIKK